VTAKKTPPASKQAPAADMTKLPPWGPVFFETFVSTADIVKALETVNVPLSAFHEWKAECRPFAEQLKVMTKRATETLRLRALSMGLAGSDKMLAIFLKTLEEEDDDLGKLTVDQLVQRITSIQRKARERAVLLHGPAAILAAMDAEHAKFAAEHTLTPNTEAAP
jgi:hypothetical protein